MYKKCYTLFMENKWLEPLSDKKKEQQPHNNVRILSTKPEQEWGLPLLRSYLLSDSCLTHNRLKSQTAQL